MTNCARVMAVEMMIEPMMMTQAPTNMHLRRPSLSEMTALNGVATIEPLFRIYELLSSGVRGRACTYTV
jgi:hypothetical protein